MIQANELKLEIEGKKILKGISIASDDSNEKKFIGILGPNGSGKSTMLKCIYRVMKADSGTVYLNGTDINDIPVKKSAREMSVVAQHNGSNFEYTVMDIVLMGRAPYKKLLEQYDEKDNELAMEALKKVGMDSMKDRVYSTLSGGEQQRIILARALAQDAGTLIMDEPTNHLDIKYQLQIMNVVKEHKGAIICALHDLNLALTYCSYVYILKDGELAFEGRPEEVITAENIYKVYEVKAKVLTLEETGRKYVVYYS